MKILFLDIDGVLNSKAWFVKLHNDRASIALKYNIMQTLDPDAVHRLNSLADIQDMMVVISSTWRRDENCLSILADQGFALPVHPDWHTPIFGRSRGEEIRHWLSVHPDVDRHVILDDNSDMGKSKRFLVQTSWEDGLQDNHIHKIREMLT